jgi:hypothetical protein
MQQSLEVSFEGWAVLKTLRERPNFVSNSIAYALRYNMNWPAHMTIGGHCYFC